MTPKEKAKELVEKFELIFISSNADAWTTPSKKCALIAVDEILNTYSKWDYANDKEFFDPYYIEVKEEIQKLERG
jgi:hypothetical protein